MSKLEAPNGGYWRLNKTHFSESRRTEATIKKYLWRLLWRVVVAVVLVCPCLCLYLCLCCCHSYLPYQLRLVHTWPIFFKASFNLIGRILYSHLRVCGLLGENVSGVLFYPGWHVHKEQTSSAFFPLHPLQCSSNPSNRASNTCKLTYNSAFLHPTLLQSKTNDVDLCHYNINSYWMMTLCEYTTERVDFSPRTFFGNECVQAVSLCARTTTVSHEGCFELSAAYVLCFCNAYINFPTKSWETCDIVFRAPRGPMHADWNVFVFTCSSRQSCIFPAEYATLINVQLVPPPPTDSIFLVCTVEYKCSPSRTPQWHICVCFCWVRQQTPRRFCICCCCCCCLLVFRFFRRRKCA